MLSTIFGVLMTLLGLFVLWCIVVGILSVCGAAVQLTLQSPIFWCAVIGGLLVYLCGGRSNEAIITGMIIGGGVMLLGYICTIFGLSKIFTIVICTLIGGFIGFLCGDLSILFGIVGFIVGICISFK